MTNRVAAHYCGEDDLAQVIAARLQNAGKDLDALTTADLATVDEFHIRGRKATLDLAERMNLRPDCEVLDIGSGLDGAARALAETYGCHVTGVDLTPAFCQAAETLSGWLDETGSGRNGHSLRGRDETGSGLLRGRNGVNETGSVLFTRRDETGPVPGGGVGAVGRWPAAATATSLA